jgi:cell division protein ZapA
MTEKNEVQVIIDGKVLTMSGFESNEYLQKLANYINNKIDSFKHSGKDIQHRLIEINIADEYFKARDKAARLGEEIKIKENELYDMKHDLINKDMVLNDTKEDLSKAMTQLQEAAKKIVQLETQLKGVKK